MRMDLELVSNIVGVHCVRRVYKHNENSVAMAFLSHIHHYTAAATMYNANNFLNVRVFFVVACVCEFVQSNSGGKHL